MPSTQRRILVLFAHPAFGKSEVNRPLFEYAQNCDFVTAVDLYAEYPHHNIDIAKEQARLKKHDVVIFQFPLYWYSTPALLKDWQDLVLEYGFAYGANGTELHNKTFMCAITAGGHKDAYCAKGYNQYTVRELLRPLEQMAHLCGMDFIPPFVLFGSRTASEDGLLELHMQQWQQLLQLLREGAPAPADVDQYPRINLHLDQLTPPTSAK